MRFLCVLHKNSYHLNIFFYHLLPFLAGLLMVGNSGRCVVALLLKVMRERMMRERMDLFVFFFGPYIK